MMKENIFLIGFMGAGKSSVARALVEKLHCPLVEMDEQIVKEQGMSINEIFEKYGEIMSVSAGVSSESIAGLSQSFRTSDIGTLLRQYAKELIGQEYMKSDVTVFPFVDRWV